MTKRMRLEFVDEPSRNALVESLKQHGMLFCFMNGKPLLTHQESLIVDMQIPGTEAGCTELRSIMAFHHGWRPSGPHCKIIKHGAMGGTYNKQMSSAFWKCFEPGCGFEVAVSGTNYITVNSFRKGYYRPGVMEIDSEIEDPYPMNHVLPVENLRPIAKSFYNTMAYGQADAQATARVYQELQLAEMTKNTSADEKFENLRKISDEVFRFMCGINFQDQPIAEQRKLVGLMSKLRKALEPADSVDRKAEMSRYLEMKKLPRPGVEI